MQALEKILEEIENESKLAHEKMRRCASENPLQFDEAKGYARGVEYVAEIIRSHMDELGCDERLVKKFVTNREVIRDFNDKPIYIKGCCPKCGYELKACETDYCKVCGQALNWDNPKGGL